MVLVLQGCVWAWGCNKYGQIGNGKTIDVFTPTLIQVGAIASPNAGTNSGASFGASGGGVGGGGGSSSSLKSSLKPFLSPAEKVAKEAAKLASATATAVAPQPPLPPASTSASAAGSAASPDGIRMALAGPRHSVCMSGNSIVYVWGQLPFIGDRDASGAEEHNSFGDTPTSAKKTVHVPMAKNATNLFLRPTSVNIPSSR